MSGGTATYKWSYTGTLPPGLKGSYSGTGAKWTLKGTPNKAGTYSFTLKATDKKGSSNTKAVKIVISDPLVISGTLKDGTQGTAYSGTLTVSKGRAPYKWTYTGSLPPGLKGSGSGAKWTLSGKPTKAGTYSFTVKATDKKGKSDTKSIKITIAEALAISGTLANGKVLEFYSSSIIALNGIGPYKWKLSGSLPPGLKSSYSGIGMTFEVFGIPTKAGTYKFTVKVTDSNGKSASKAFTIKISSSAFAYSAKTDSSTLDVGAEFFITSLSVASDDIIEAGEGAYSDIISIKAGVQVSFQVGTWVRPNGTLVAVDDATVFVDDEPLDDIAVAEDGTFELPTDMVADDFKVYVKGTTGSEELTTGTLYIRAEE